MDHAIRQLLLKSERDFDGKSLDDAFEKLKRGRKDVSDQTEPFSSDLFVICAQTALKLDEPEIAAACMKLYFQKTPPQNEFLCHAYLCQAQLNAPPDSNSREKLKQCVAYVLKAINYAKAHERFHYLVFNASVLYWAFVRPFLIPNSRYLIATSLQIVVKALEEINDEDYEWRAELSIYLLECLIDSGKKEESQNFSQVAFDFTKANAPLLCKKILAMQVKYRLVDPANIKSSVKGNPELSIYYQMLNLSGDPQSINLINEASDVLNRICGDGSDDNLRRQSSNNIRLSSKSTQKAALLLDLARTCIKLQNIEIADKCVAVLNNLDMDLKLSLQVDFLKCELKVKNTKKSSNIFNKNSIEVRLQAIKSLEAHLITAKRTGDGDVIQIGCLTMWNLCLPLLQNNLRKNISAYLTLAVTLLDEINSLLLSLRCQLHFEVAKCEEEKEQLPTAILHLIKALELDNTGSYKAQISHKLERLKLKSILYDTPTRAEDHAAMIIEQAESSKEASTPAMMREYLMKAGLLLAPDAFHLAMEGEEALMSAKVGDSPVEKLAAKVTAYETGISKLNGHIQRLENANDKERVLLWADLVKTARRQKVWDVTRIAAMFCLLYDDSRWVIPPANVENSPSKSVDSKISGYQSQPSVPSMVEFGIVSREHLEGEAKFHENEDFLTLFAEINFILAEALVELLMKEGYKLLDKVKASEETKLTPKLFQKENIKTTDKPEWKQYTAWVEGISKKALSGFLRSSTLGVDLSSSWIVCNAGIYVWNYTNHHLSIGHYDTLKPYLLPLFKNIKAVGHGSETIFLCDLAHAIAQGCIQPSLVDVPTSTSKMNMRMLSGNNKGGRNTKLGRASNRNMASKTDLAATELTASSLKEAIEILEFVLMVTSGNSPNNIVPIYIRYPLIKALVLCKGLLHQPLPKNYGHDNDSKESQGPMSKALYVLEAMLLQSKGIVEFPACPNVTEVIRMVELSVWTDNVLLLQVWAELSVLTFNMEDIKTATECSNKALACRTTVTKDLKKSSKKKSKRNEDRYILEQELLYYACTIKGQCLVVTMNGRPETRRLALDCFVDACKFASLSSKEDLVMTAARHVWNTTHPIIKNPFDRQMLKEPIKEVLKYIEVVAKYLKTDNDDDETKEDEFQSKPLKPSRTQSKTSSSKKDMKKKSATTLQKKEEAVPEEVAKTKDSEFDENLKLRAALYGVLFQAYADKNELKEGIKAMDNAIKAMPRTHHRLLIFKHRIITNAKLDKPVLFDMGKFSEESEAIHARMWYQVATNSVKKKDQMSAYINAIQTLTREEFLLQKVDYLSEFAEWMFVNEYDVTSAVDQLQYGIALLINGSSHVNESKLTPASSKGIERELEKIKDVKKMDILVHLYVMIASIVGPAHALFKQCNLSAAFLVQNIWKTAITNAEYALKGGKKSNDAPKERKGHSPDHLKLDSSPTRLSGSRKSTTKIGGKHSKTALPNTMEAWTVYSVPDNIKELFKTDTSGSYLSSVSITRPELSLFFLESLVRNLYCIGFHHLAIFPIRLMGFIAEDILKNTSVSKLIHMQSCELYEILKMKIPYQQHQKFIQGAILTEEEQALSREECNIRDEKKNELKKYQLTHIDPDNKPGPEERATSALRLTKVDSDYSCQRYTWCKMADYLIKWGQCQKARVLLEEAKLSALTFDDDVCIELVNHYNTCIANKEKDWGKVTLLVEDSKECPKSRNMWLKKVFIFVDSVHDLSAKSTCSTNDKGFQIARKILNDAISKIDEMMKAERNKISIGPYLKASLVGKLGLLLYKESKITRDSSDEGLLENAIQHVTESYKELKELGYVFESMTLIEKCIHMHLQFLSDKEGDERKKLLVQTYDIGKVALSEVTCLMTEIMSISTSEVVGDVNLPIMQLLHDLQNTVMVVMQGIISVAMKEKKERAAREESKKLINRVIDTYVDIPCELTPLQSKWHTTINLITQDALAMCASVNKLKKDPPEYFGKASLHVGSFMNVVSRYDMADELDAWFVTGVTQNAEYGSYETDEEELKQSNKLPFCDDMQKKFKFQQYLMFSSQSVEFLLHAIQNGLQYGDNEMLSSSSLQLVEIVGKRDSILAVNMLALFQSVGASNFLKASIKQAFIDPRQSGGASLLLQNEILKNTCKTKFNSFLDENESALEHCEWWRRLSITRCHLDLLKLIPFNVTYVILQHSSNKKYIYGGVMERGSPEVVTKKSAKSPTPTVRSCIERKETEEALLGQLLELNKEYKILVCRELMLENKERADSELKKEFEENKTEVEGAVAAVPKETCQMKQERKQRLGEALDTLIAATEAYFGSLLDSIELALKSSTLPEVVVILADHHLLELPLESLSVFKMPGIKSVGRDFSIQMFHDRCNQESDPNNNAKTVKGKLPGKDGKGGDKSAAKKPAKLDPATVKSVMPMDNLSIDLSSVKYLVDPYNDLPQVCTEPRDIIEDVTSIQRQKLSKWSGIKGCGGVTNLKDMQELIESSDAFLFAGFTRLLSVIPPSYLATMNLGHCNLFILLDLVQNSNIYLRQGSLDALKSDDRLLLENPVQTAALLSVCGVKTVLMNHWSTTWESNSEKLCHVFQGLYEKSVSLGEAVKCWRRSGKEFPSVSEESSNETLKKSKNKTESEIAPPAEEFQEIPDDRLINDRLNFVLYGIPNMVSS